MKFLINTLGCKVNTYESNVIRDIFLNEGYEESNSNVDIAVINTCTVTNTSDSKSLKVIKHTIKNNPNAIVVAFGCFCEFRKANINDLIDAEIILGTKNKTKVLKCIKDYEKNHERIILFDDSKEDVFEDMEIKKYEHHHRAFIKIEDGCIIAHNIRITHKQLKKNI